MFGILATVRGSLPGEPAITSPVFGDRSGCSLSSCEAGAGAPAWGLGVAGSVQTESEDSLKMLGDCWRLVISIEVKSI